MRYSLLPFHFDGTSSNRLERFIGISLFSGLILWSATVPSYAQVNIKEPVQVTVQAANYAQPGQSEAVRVGQSGTGKTIAMATPTTASIATPSRYTTYYPSDFRQAQAPIERINALTNFITGYNKNVPRPQANAMAEAIVEFSQYYQIDPRLVTSMIAVESSFRPDAISSSGAIGLGQLKPATATWLGVANPFDPIENIAGMTRYLAWLTRKYNGSYDHAVSAYYQGPGTVDRQGITDICLPYLLKVNNVLARF